MSTDTVLLDIEKAFHTTQHLGLLWKLSKLQFSISPIKLISAFLSQRKFRVSVECEGIYKQGCHKVPSCPQHCTVYALNTLYLSRSLCWWHLYMGDRPLIELCSQKAAARSQCGVSAGTYKSMNVRFRLWPPEAHITLNGRNIPFVNHVKFLGVIFDMRITCRLHTETTEAKIVRTFIWIYSIFKSERLSANNKLTLHKTPIRSIMTYACPAGKLAADTS
jgi:hypothetical protein